MLRFQIWLNQRWLAYLNAVCVDKWMCIYSVKIPPLYLVHICTQTVFFFSFYGDASSAIMPDSVAPWHLPVTCRLDKRPADCGLLLIIFLKSFSFCPQGKTDDWFNEKVESLHLYGFSKRLIEAHISSQRKQQQRRDIAEAGS